VSVRPIALLRLARVSLAPSAAADPLVGLVLAGGGAWPAGARALPLVAASLGVYHGALVLNDWADREADRRARPERPLPRGEVAPVTALALGAALVLGGVAAACAVAPGVGAWMALVAALAVGYDLAGRGPLLGPFLLGACRAGNLGAGMLAAGAGEGLPARAWLLPALYGGYVFSLSRLARLEDEEDPRPLGQRPRALVLAALALLAGVPLGTWLLPGGPSALGAGAAAAVVGVALLRPARAALRQPAWSRAEVGRLTGMLLRRLLAFGSAAALLTLEGGRASLAVGLGVLAGYPLSWALRRAFPPT